MKHVVHNGVMVIRQRFEAILPHIALQQREQQALRFLGCAMVGIILWRGIWQPVQDWRQQSQSQYGTAFTNLSWMKNHQADVKKIKTASVDPTTNNEVSLLSIAGDSAQSYKIALGRIEPSGDGTLHVSLENSSFDRLVLWLEALKEQHDITVRQASIEKVAATGHVNATLTLERVLN